MGKIQQKNQSSMAPIGSLCCSGEWKIRTIRKDVKSKVPKRRNLYFRHEGLYQDFCGNGFRILEPDQ